MLEATNNPIPCAIELNIIWKSEITKTLPARFNAASSRAERGRKLELAAGLDAGQLPRQLDNPMASGDERRIGRLAASGQYPHHHAVAGGKRDVSQRQRDSHRGGELAILAQG